MIIGSEEATRRRRRHLTQRRRSNAAVTVHSRYKLTKPTQGTKVAGGRDSKTTLVYVLTGPHAFRTRTQADTARLISIPHARPDTCRGIFRTSLTDTLPQHAFKSTPKYKFSFSFDLKWLQNQEI